MRQMPADEKHPPGDGAAEIRWWKMEWLEWTALAALFTILLLTAAMLAL